MRPYDQELVMCQRYWQAIPPYQFNVYGAVGSNVAQPVFFPAAMRVAPTVALTNISNTGISATTNVLNQAPTTYTTYRSITTTGLCVWIESATLDARL
jgi:hypothetical protein